MKLYGSDQSPFVARIKIACRAKGLSPELLSLPPGGLASPGFLAINPVGKVPVLIDGDNAIIESETILHYIEDCYPDPPLCPNGALEQARMRTIIQLTDGYVMPAVSRLFGQLDPENRETSIVDAEVGRWRTGLGWLAQFVADAPYALGTDLTLADCVLAPSLLLNDVIAAMLGLGDLLAAHPNLTGYRVKVRQNLIVREELDRTQAAMAALAAG